MCGGSSTPSAAGSSSRTGNRHRWRAGPVEENEREVVGGGAPRPGVHVAQERVGRSVRRQGKAGSDRGLDALQPEELVRPVRGLDEAVGIEEQPVSRRERLLQLVVVRGRDENQTEALLTDLQDRA